MRTALDTNVLSALWSNEQTASQVTRGLTEAYFEGGLVVCAPVYVELLAHPSAPRHFVDEFLEETAVQVDFSISEDVWRLAAKSFAIYAERRRRSAGGSPKRLVVDFIVAAHASLCADRLMTLDPNRYTRDFPKLKLV